MKEAWVLVLVFVAAFGLIYFVEIISFERFHSIYLLIAVFALIYSSRKPQDENVND